jgi:DNA-directed RNA polymerase
MAFAGVHDSFWTHAGDVDRMNELLRDAFVRLHSRPLLEELKAEFEAHFPRLVFPDVPERVRMACMTSYVCGCVPSTA